MAKVRLNLDQLQVESFDTLGVRPARGTVRGNLDAIGGDFEANIPPPTDPLRDCKRPPLSTICPVSVVITCPDTCPNTCPFTCDINCTALCTYGCTEVYSECRFTGDPVCCV